jgi:hypothetical protein
MNSHDKVHLTARRDTPWKSWALVWGLALAFLLYGLLMFVIVGDKGPPDWDFGVVEDVPGKSVYSTSPEPGDVPAAPDPQHVAGKPALAPAPGEGGQK